MNEDLTRRISELITKLKDLSGQSDISKRKMESFEKTINLLSTALSKLNSGANLTNLSDQLARLEQAVSRGESARTRIAGGRGTIPAVPFISQTPSQPTLPVGQSNTNTAPAANYVQRFQSAMLSLIPEDQKDKYNKMLDALINAEKKKVEQSIKNAQRETDAWVREYKRRQSAENAILEEQQQKRRAALDNEVKARQEQSRLIQQEVVKIYKPDDYYFKNRREINVDQPSEASNQLRSEMERQAQQAQEDERLIKELEQRQARVAQGSAKLRQSPSFRASSAGTGLGAMYDPRKGSVNVDPTSAEGDALRAEIQRRYAQLDQDEKLIAELEKKQAEVAKSLERLKRSSTYQLQQQGTATGQGYGTKGTVSTFGDTNQSDQLRDSIVDKYAKIDEANKRQVEILKQAVAEKEAIYRREEQANRRQIALLEEYVQKKQSAMQKENYLASDFRYKYAKEAVAKIDPELSNADPRIFEEASTGIARYTFAMDKADGITKQVAVTVDKFGRVLIDNQKRFRDFASNVVRDIAEVAKWSIAVAVVYGPIQKFSELMSDMVEIESQLADVQIALNSSQEALNRVFESSFRIAQETGEEIGGVVEAYNQAYRVTGQIRNENERLLKSNILLKDSIALAKLSTLDQAQSIDILSAALKQSGMELDQGTVLLDKWIAVSKVSNVDLTTLATGFSVVADTADAAGVSTDRLNAVIASIAETSGSGAKEIANTVRAIIAGFQSDKAVAELNKFGIAVEDAEGNVRSFIDISQELYEKRQSGQLSNEAFTQLTAAIGGGTRRQAPVAAFIETFGRQADLEQASMNASGETADALSTKIENVATNITLLGNAFRDLAYSLGEKGGLLDTFSAILKVVTSLVTGISDLASVAGRSGPTLLATLGAVAYLSKQTPEFRGAIGSKIAGFGSGLIENNSIFKKILPQNTLTNLGNTVGTGLSNNLGRIASVGAVGFSAFSNFSSGNTGAGFANIAGGLLGAITGNPLLAVVGSTLAESFYNGVLTKEGDWTDFFSRVNPPDKKELKPGDQGYTESLQDTAGRRLEELVNTKWTDKITNFLGMAATNVSGFFSGTGGLSYEQTLLARLGSQYQKGEISKTEYESIVKAFQEANAQTQGEAGDFGTDPAIIQKFNTQFSGIIKTRLDELVRAMTTGDITLSQYRYGREEVQNIGNIAPTWMNTFLKGTKGAPEGISQILSYGNKEQLALFNSIAQSIIAINKDLENSNLTEKEKNDLIEKRNDLLLQGVSIYNLTLKAIQEEKDRIAEANAEKLKAKAPGFQSFDMTSAAFDSAMQGYESVLGKLQGFGYMPDEQTQISIFNDGIIKPMTKDWKVVQFLLAEILKTEQKQLDGMYNLPSDATFMVPYNAAKYGLNEGAGDLLKKLTEVTSPGKEIAVGTPDIASGQRYQAMYDHYEATRSNKASTDRYTQEAYKFKEALVRSLWDNPTIPGYNDAGANPLTMGPKELQELNARSMGGSIPNNTAIKMPEVSTKLNLNLETRASVNLNYQKIGEMMAEYQRQQLVKYAGGQSSQRLTLM